MAATAESLRKLDEATAADVLQAIESPTQLEAALEDFTDEEAAQLLFDWSLWARPTQTWPADWIRGWLIMAGRGFGKTRTALEAARAGVEDFGYRHLMLAGPTARDTRRIMLTGQSGLLRRV